MLAKKLLEAAGNATLPTYIEDVFSTYLYTGNGSTQTITNGIDLAGKGGLVWVKRRNSPANDHAVMDTARGIATNGAWTLIPNGTYDQFDTNTVTSFNSNGFTLGSSSFGNSGGGFDYASWTFRKQPKFFDVVTYTGNGAMDRNIAHSLGSVPACIIIKRTDTTSNWVVWHGSNFSGGYATSQKFLYLNTTGASPQIANGYVADSYNSSPSTQFMVLNSNGYGSSGSVTDVNASGGTYVAYLYAHNAGGFGLTGTDNVISCGSYTGNGSATGPTVTLGYEPQWLLVKNAISVRNWFLVDNMRGLTVGGVDPILQPNSSSAEQSSSSYDYFSPTATGFAVTNSDGDVNANGDTYIYIAIRRGPMKVPTSGTSVFSPNQTSGTTGTQITTGFPVDWQLLGINAGNVYNQRSSTRLTGVNTNGSSNSQYLVTSNTNAEAATGSVTLNWGSTGFQVPSLNSGSPTIFWNFGRAPSFFDEVCYTGTGVSGQAYNHNLGVAPELMIVKARGNAYQWWVYDKTNGKAGYSVLNTNSAWNGNTTVWGNANPTASVFTVGAQSQVNESGTAFVAYLFATCAGVSKVGSYTGNGSTQTINCGFTGGARFVLIKRTDDIGDWYVYDTARGMTVLTDPYLLLNSSAAESATLGSVTTVSTGFAVNASILAAINTNGASYIFLAIA